MNTIVMVKAVLLKRDTTNDVALDDFLHNLWSDRVIPNTIWVDDSDWTGLLLANLETSNLGSKKTTLGSIKLEFLGTIV